MRSPESVMVRPGPAVMVSEPVRSSTDAVTPVAVERVVTNLPTLTMSGAVADPSVSTTPRDGRGCSPSAVLVTRRMLSLMAVTVTVRPSGVEVAMASLATRALTLIASANGAKISSLRFMSV